MDVLEFNWEINRSRKEVNRLLSKRIPNIKLLLNLQKLHVSGFKKSVTRFVFEELKLTQRSLNFKTSCCNLKTRVLGAKMCVAFLIFDFERNYDVLKSKSRCNSLSKTINFNKNQTESKMENPKHSFRETKLVFQFI